MQFSSIFEQTSQNIKEKDKKSLKDLSKEEKVKKEKELKSKQFLRILSVSITRYITKSIADSIGTVNHKARPLSILEGRYVKNKEDFKIVPETEGGPTQEKVYASAIELAKKLGWKGMETGKQNKEPIITPYNKPKSSNTEDTPDLVKDKIKSELKLFNVSEEEIIDLNSLQTLELLQQKNLEQEIKDPEFKRPYSVAEISQDFSLLQKLWDESYEDMDSINDSQRTSEILDLTAKTDNSDLLEKYIKVESQNLKPEEKFFIEISIQVKKFRQKAREVISVGSQESISDSDFELFTDKNQISESILSDIAKSIAEHKPLSERQIAIYTYHSSKIEEILTHNSFKRDSSEKNLKREVSRYL